MKKQSKQSKPKKVQKQKKPTPRPVKAKASAKAAAVKVTAKPKAKPAPKAVAKAAKAAVNRPARKQKSKVVQVAKRTAKRTARKQAPGRDRRRARAIAQPKTTQARKPVQKAPSKAQKPRTLAAAVARASNDPLGTTGKQRGQAPSQAKGTFLLHRLSGTARSGQWTVEARPTGDEPQLIGSAKPFARAEKALAAVARLFPKLTRVPSDSDGWRKDTSEAVRNNKLAEKAPAPAPKPKTRKSPRTGPGELANAVSGVPTSMVSGVPENGTDLVDDDQTVADLAFQGDQARYVPPPVTGDPPIQ